MKHESCKWLILGTIDKPKSKRKYHNNVMLYCKGCPKVRLTVNNRTVTYYEFETIDKLAEMCLRNGYIPDLWGKV